MRSLKIVLLTDILATLYKPMKMSVNVNTRVRNFYDDYPISALENFVHMWTMAHLHWLCCNLLRQFVFFILELGGILYCFYNDNFNNFSSATMITDDNFKYKISLPQPVLKPQTYAKVQKKINPTSQFCTIITRVNGGPGFGKCPNKSRLKSIWCG